MRPGKGPSNTYQRQEAEKMSKAQRYRTDMDIQEPEVSVQLEKKRETTRTITPSERSVEKGGYREGASHSNNVRYLDGGSMPHDSRSANWFDDSTWSKDQLYTSFDQFWPEKKKVNYPRNEQRGKTQKGSGWVDKSGSYFGKKQEHNDHLQSEKGVEQTQGFNYEHHRQTRDLEQSKPRWNNNGNKLGKSKQCSKKDLVYSDSDAHNRKSKWKTLTNQYKQFHFNFLDQGTEETSQVDQNQCNKSHSSENGKDSPSNSNLSGRKRSSSVSDVRLSKTLRAEKSESMITHKPFSVAGLSQTSGERPEKSKWSTARRNSTCESDSNNPSKESLAATLPEGLVSRTILGGTTKISVSSDKDRQEKANKNSLDLTFEVRATSGITSVPSSSAEGVLEKAERVCKVLKEKRHQSKLQASDMKQHKVKTNTTLDNSVQKLHRTQHEDQHLGRSLASSSQSVSSFGSKKSFASSTFNNSNALLDFSAKEKLQESRDESSGLRGNEDSFTNHITRIRKTVEASVLAESKLTRFNVDNEQQIQPVPVSTTTSCYTFSSSQPTSSTPISSVSCKQQQVTSIYSSPLCSEAQRMTLSSRMSTSPQLTPSSPLFPQPQQTPPSHSSSPRPQPTVSTPTTTCSTSTASNKTLVHHGTFTREALARMVNAPSTRAQRVQLARILRQHASSVPKPRSVRLGIQLEGLYNSSDECASTSNLLDDLPRLEQLGLGSIKIEDLSDDDKLLLADIIELQVTDEGGVRDKDGFVMPSPVTAERLIQSESEACTKDSTASADKSKLQSSFTSRPLSLNDLQVDSSSSTAAGRLSSQERLELYLPVPSKNMNIDRDTVSVSECSLGPAKTPVGVEKVTVNAATFSEGSAKLPEVNNKGDHQLPDLSSGKAVLMDFSNSDAENNCLVICQDPLVHGNDASRQETILMEVMLANQKQDNIMAEMRNIDMQLSEQYKSLIEIVAQMSVLQRRRVQLQAEGEALSKQRNALLTGILPDANTRHPLHESLLPYHNTANRGLRRQEDFDSMAGSEDDALALQIAASRSVAASDNALNVQDSESLLHFLTSNHAQVTSETKQQHACFSGSSTFNAGSRDPSGKDEGLGKDYPSSEINETVKGLQRKESGLTLIGWESSTMRKGSKGEDEAEGLCEESSPRVCTKRSIKVGMSASTSLTHQDVRWAGQDERRLLANRNVVLETNKMHEDRDNCKQFNAHSHSSWWNADYLPLQQTVTVSQNKVRPFAEVPKSPSVNLTYIGSTPGMSTNLVQNIVRSLPLTSQLGEVCSPTSMNMLVLKSANSMQESSSSDSETDTSETSDAEPIGDPPLQTKPSSQPSCPNFASNLISEEYILTSGVQSSALDSPHTDHSRGSDPVNELKSDYSSTDHFSHRKQIKTMSEKNGMSDSQLMVTKKESHLERKEEKAHLRKPMHAVKKCSVVLKKLSADDLVKQLHEPYMTKVKIRKSRRDRDCDVKHRRPCVIYSSSEEELSSTECPPAGEATSTEHTLFSEEWQSPSGAEINSEENPDSVHLASATENIPMPENLTKDTSKPDGMTSLLFPMLNPNLLRFKPNSLETFRANIKRSLRSSSGSDKGAEVSEENAQNSMALQNDSEVLKITGPSIAVVGLKVCSQHVYICFQDYGVRSYSLDGQQEAEFEVPSAQCCDVASVGNRSQHYLAVGAEEKLVIISTKEQKEVYSRKAEARIRCMLVKDLTLYVGLNSGSVLFVNLKILKETREVQASYSPVHCLAWAQEGNVHLLCAAAQDAFIHILDVASGLPLRILKGHTKTAFSIIVSGELLISGSGDQTVMAHNVHNGELLWLLDDYKGMVTSVCVENGLLFCAGYNKVIHCYDLKTRKLLHQMYGAGKSTVTKMIVHNSVLYTGNRDGQVEAVCLQNMGSFPCGCVSCTVVFSLREHLWHHLVADHLLPNSRTTLCPWKNCSVIFNTKSALQEAADHMWNHVKADEHLVDLKAMVGLREGCKEHTQDCRP